MASHQDCSEISAWFRVLYVLQLTCRHSLDNDNHIRLSNVTVPTPLPKLVEFFVLSSGDAWLKSPFWRSHHIIRITTVAIRTAVYCSTRVVLEFTTIRCCHGTASSASLTDGELFLVAGVCTGDPRTGCGIAHSSRIRSRERDRKSVV